METVMLSDGADVGRRSNGRIARKLREATAEERASYRKWMRGVIAFYSVALLVSAVILFVGYSSGGLTQLTNLAARHAPALPRTD
jgi:hypothetical protein